MVVNTIVTDNESGLKAEVVKKDSCNCQALAVATIPYLDFENSIKFFTNPDYGADMNQDALAGGTPEEVHNGTDDALWTGTQVAGGGEIDFDSTNQNHTDGGSKSVFFNRCEVDDTAQFAKGSSLDCSGYVALTMYIYVDNNWNTLDSFSIYGYDTGTTSIVGNSVDLQDYFNFETQDVWQKITIPLEDMGLSGETIDALRINCDAIEGNKPQFYIDDMQFEETGSPIAFTLKADKGTWLHVTEFTLSLADEYAGTLSDGTMPLIPYDKFLGVTLAAGINYRRVQDQQTKFSQNILSLMEFVQLSGTEVAGYGSDGTNTWLTLRIKHIEPFVLKSENDDTLSFTIADDLSELLHLRISAGCKVEQKKGNSDI